MSRYMIGSDLPEALQREALSAFGKHRFTGEYRPASLDDPSVDSYRRHGPPDFADDAEWLAHTEFPMSGKEGVGTGLKLARNGMRAITHYIREPLHGADEIPPNDATTFALAAAKLSGRPVWVLVEGTRVGDMTFMRPTTGLPSMWRVATPTGDLY